MTRDVLKVENLQKSYGDLCVLVGVSTTVQAGECVSIIGPSGSGKTTFLRCLNYLEKPTAGHIHLEDMLIGERLVGDRYIPLTEKQLAPQRLQMGFVFQNFCLWPHLTVLENVALSPFRAMKLSKSESLAIARNALERVHIAHKADEYPDRLSGGQQQRVGIARALAQRPKVILFDEPTSALDPELVGEVLEVIGELAADGLSMVLVTHEITFARDVATKVIFMDGGRIVEEGAPRQVIMAPTQERTIKFLSKFHAN